MGSLPSKSTAAVMMSLSSLHCYRRVHKGCRYAKAAYRLYFLTGISTIVRDTIFSPSEYFVTLTDVLFAWCYVLGLPLLAADVCRCSGALPDLAAVHLIIPVASLTMFHVNPEHVDPYLLAVSHSCSILAILVCGVVSGHSASFAFSLSYYFAMFRLDPMFDKGRMVDFMEHWQFIIAISNLFSAYLLPR
ncbi:uncharacterized protein LOC106668217 isoform X2 [Cimex lectularius]|uniref:Uncharacterized protein n=1 Tax=Cimex lectularius TaxID=79782 RepID=A0A8I6SFJ0_CIMLE|nr:uncharacterized protein LOC106668217 isoform X2 [Cimex lectularius]